MDWEISVAKNGENTLNLNGIQLYSNYRPREDAWRWVDAEFDESKSSYLLIGLGLGYHAERLIELATGKPVYVYYFDQQEYNYASIPQAVAKIPNIEFEDCQILLPNVWVKALSDHPLLPFLEDIKIRQVTFKNTAAFFEANFKENLKLQHLEEYPTYSNKIAFLIASGPSLNETIEWIEELKGKVDLFVVGSALKMLLKANIHPNATIISDPKPDIVQQIDGANYSGDLYYLSTANHNAVTKHGGKSYILFQEGYKDAERAAQQYNKPLIETGGSVSTSAISLLEILGYEKIILFGQDMGFSGTQTHASLSTSGRTVTKDLNIRAVKANDGSDLFTMPNFQVYARWIERKAKTMQSKLYTTSQKGVALEGVKYVNKQQLMNLLS